MFKAPEIKSLAEFNGNVAAWSEALRRTMQQALSDLERISASRDRAALEPYLISNVTLTRTLDASTISAADLADVVGTLIHDFGLRRILRVPT